MRGKSERHGRSVRQVASRLRTHQEASCAMGTYAVVLKQWQGDHGIPSGVPFGKRMGLARQGIESIAEGTIDARSAGQWQVQGAPRLGRHGSRWRAACHAHPDA